jgi:thioredoxin reductase (NADPH)
MNDCIILGSGPAGLTAAIYLARAGIQPIILSGNQVGGQLTTTTVVENFPGFPEGITGPVLMFNMMEQAKKMGAVIEMQGASEVDLSGPIKKITGEDGKKFSAKAVLIATGAAPRKLGVKGEETYWGKGVSCCATCDGAFFKGKVVAVAGGGDTAVEEAEFLTRFASKVFLIHRRDQLRASEIMQERIKKNPKVEILWNTVVKEIKGDGKKVSGLTLQDAKNNSERELAVEGFFLAIGHLPNTGFLKGAVETDEEGFIKAVDGTGTSAAGVFTAGDVRDKRYRQAITAAGMGCMAALDIEKYLSAQ